MESPLRDKSYIFALRIVKLHKYLVSWQKELVLSRQILRSGTSIGASIMEAQYAQSKKDFVNKLSIALKEANETRYWLKLLRGSEYISDNMFYSIQPCVLELIKILTASINTAKESLRQGK